MIIFIFFLLIILILIICSITINSYRYTNNKKTPYSEGGGYKEDFDELSNNLNTIYKKIEGRNFNEEDIWPKKTRTDTINDIIKENKKNINYYEIKSHKGAPSKKIPLDELENLLDIGNVPEGRFFLKNGKIINT